jgi:hypothetical protein
VATALAAAAFHADRPRSIWARWPDRGRPARSPVLLGRAENWYESRAAKHCTSACGSASPTSSLAKRTRRRSTYSGSSPLSASAPDNRARPADRCRAGICAAPR